MYVCMYVCRYVSGIRPVQTCMTALNQQVLPMFLSPTGVLPILFLLCGFLGSWNNAIIGFDRPLTPVSLRLASRALHGVGGGGRGGPII